ncbi:hypothetical protein TWF788_000990 [Orbilia oligospora]|uniref:Uncharacterized protein n=1 Tax=Orbilia oligospora TaxID=2813651 RepID=A0A7C8VEI2_ORBOL|nr:hypothetical protein TWF788_000990 [Orbilia oligospora]KAF3231333.1 hypothetical protein TWF191_006823 [Orbilia oligospora]
MHYGRFRDPYWPEILKLDPIITIILCMSNSHRDIERKYNALRELNAIPDINAPYYMLMACHHWILRSEQNVIRGNFRREDHPEQDIDSVKRKT